MNGEARENFQFLYIAKGSCGEVRAQLQVASDQSYIQESEYLKLKELCRLINGMISNFVAHLQQTDYLGEKKNRPKRLMRQNEVEKWNGIPDKNDTKFTICDQTENS